MPSNDAPRNNEPRAAEVRPAGPRGYKRSWKNLLINRQYQLRFTLFMVVLSTLLITALADAREAEEQDSSELRERLARAASATERLGAEAEHLRQELERTRDEMARLDPVQTEIGRRWIWLVAALILVLGVLIAFVGYSPPP